MKLPEVLFVAADHQSKTITVSPGTPSDVPTAGCTPAATDDTCNNVCHDHHLYGSSANLSNEAGAARAVDTSFNSEQPIAKFSTAITEITTSSSTVSSIENQRNSEATHMSGASTAGN